jgi:hypothetical protein
MAKFAGFRWQNRGKLGPLNYLRKVEMSAWQRYKDFLDISVRDLPLVFFGAQTGKARFLAR